jgi:hypothetical protein
MSWFQLVVLTAEVLAVKRFLQKHLSVDADISLHFAWGRKTVRVDEQKTKRYHRPAMSPKTCTVSLTDVRGSRHTVEVMADSLFEAAVSGLKILRENGWVPDTPGPATRLDIQVKEPAVSHHVTVLQIHRWLEGASISPNEMVRKQKLKAILG